MCGRMVHESPKDEDSEMGRIILYRAEGIPEAVFGVARMCMRLLVAFAAFTTTSCGGPELSPNIVLISLDTVRADQLTPYGYARDTSPALAALAAEGALFSQSYSQAPNTVPSHASMLTGRYPFEHGMYVHGDSLRPSEQTLAEILGQHGYHTFALASSLRFHDKSGYDQGFDIYETFYDDPKNERATLINQRALALAKESDEKPFFAFLHYFGAHGPYAAPTPYREMWHPGLDRPTPENSVTFMTTFRNPPRPLDLETVEYLRALYDGGVRHQDDALANLFAALRENPNGRPTLIVVTSDHGEGFKEHGVLMHSRYLYEELVRVPMVFWWPGKVEEGMTVDHPSQSVDLLPTILELAGLPLAVSSSGRSFAGVLTGETNQPTRVEDPLNDYVVLEARPSWALVGTVNEGRFKFVAGRGGGLFRLDAEGVADEDVDVSARYPKVARHFRDLATSRGLATPHRSWMIAHILAKEQALPVLPKPRARVQRSPEEQEMLDRLRSLGYIEEADGGLGELPSDSP